MVTPFRQSPSLFRVQSLALRETGMGRKDPSQSSLGWISHCQIQTQIRQKRLQSVAGVASVCGPTNWSDVLPNPSAPAARTSMDLQVGRFLFEMYQKLFMIKSYVIRQVRFLMPFLPLMPQPQRYTLDISSLPMQVINCFIFTLNCKHVRLLKLISMLPETGMLN